MILERCGVNPLFKVVVGGVVVSSLWGMYYNVLPVVFDYYPFGISLEGLTFFRYGSFRNGLCLWRYSYICIRRGILFE